MNHDHHNEMHHQPRASFGIGTTLVEAWHHVRGTKWPLWVVTLVIFAILIGVVSVFGLLASWLLGVPFAALLSMPPNSSFIIAQFIISIIIYAIVAPFVAGAVMTAVKKARGEVISVKSPFQFFHRWLPIGFLLVLLLVAIFILNTLLAIPTAFFIAINSFFGTYFTVLINIIAYLLLMTFLAFSIPAMADRNLSVTEAFAHSCKIVRPHWLRVFGILVAYYFFALIGVVPAALGHMCPVLSGQVIGVLVTILYYIWVIPYLHLIIGTTYHKLNDHH